MGLRARRRVNGASCVRLFLISALSAFACIGAAHATCQDNVVQLRGEFGEARFRVEIADEPAERAQGLMNRETMPMSAGMLFIYEREQEVSFWMENTLIPLDMIFADAHGVVVKVHENAIPLDRTSIPSEEPSLAVLEINGGLAAQIGIEPGAELRHPGLPQAEAAWPCE